MWSLFLLSLCCGLRFVFANDKNTASVSREKLDTLRSTLVATKNKVKEILDGFDKRWEIKNYPNFHRSVAMTHTGWEVLKVQTLLNVTVVVPIIIS